MSLPLQGSFPAGAAVIAARLPQIARAMVIARDKGTTHERIGRIEDIAEQNGWTALSGAGHAARFETGKITAIRFDRSAGMKDKILPRLDFLGISGVAVFSVVSLSGLEEFDAAFAGLDFELLSDAPPNPLAAAMAEIGQHGIAEDDPAFGPFRAAQSGGWTAQISFVADGFEQQWQGVIAEIKPAMGFLNVMTPDFHLHLKGGSIGAWSEGAAVWQALDGAGKALGLSLRRIAP